MALNPEMKIQSVELAPATVGMFVMADPPQLSFDPQSGRIDRVIASYINEDNEAVPVGKITTEPYTNTAKDNIGGKVTGTGYRVGGFVGEAMVYEDFARHAFIDFNHKICSWSPEEIHERKTAIQIITARAVFRHLEIDFPVPGRSKRNLRGRATRERKAIAEYLVSSEAAA